MTEQSEIKTGKQAEMELAIAKIEGHDYYKIAKRLFEEAQSSDKTYQTSQRELYFTLCQLVNEFKDEFSHETIIAILRNRFGSELVRAINAKMFEVADRVKDLGQENLRHFTIENLKLLPSISKEDASKLIASDRHQETLSKKIGGKSSRDFKADLQKMGIKVNEKEKPTITIEKAKAKIEKILADSISEMDKIRQLISTFPKLESKGILALIGDLESEINRLKEILNEGDLVYDQSEILRGSPAPELER